MRNPPTPRRRRWRLALFAAVLIAVGAAGGLVASAAAPNEGPIVGADSPGAIADSYIVVLKPTMSSDVAGRAGRLAAQFNGKVNHTFTTALHGFAISMSAGQARKLAAHPDVAYVQQNHRVQVDSVQPNPPSWGLDRVDQRDVPLDSSYTYSTMASNVHVYVIDTGILFTHNEFGGRASTGVDEVTPGGTATDCNGHGTHVAGTIGGSTYGVAKGVSLVAVRVLGCDGSGTTAGVVAGVDWVTAHAVKPAVANMSLGGAADVTTDTAVTNAIASGVTFTVSAGNAGTDACGFSPARVSGAITVGATDRNDNRPSWSNYGSCLDLFAPGVDIASSWATSVTASNTISGTSMASPHVAGAAALVLADHPTYTPDQVRDSLVGNATPSKIVGQTIGSPNLLLYTGTTPVPAPAANDFDVSAGTNTMLAVGASVSGLNLSLLTTAGSPQNVTLSATDLPPGVSISFGQTSLNTGQYFCTPGSGIPGGPCTFTDMQFTASASATPGRYVLGIIATGTATTHTLSFPLMVTDNKGAYYPLDPARILDTRFGNGAPTAPLGAGQTLSLQVTGRAGVPASGVAAIVLNVTATNATAASYVTVWPSGVGKPIASSLNLRSGWTGANSVTVAVGSDGKVNIYNDQGSTDMIADVVGFYAADASIIPTMGNQFGGNYQPLEPVRLFDSRTVWHQKLCGDCYFDLSVDFGSEFNQHVKGYVVNVTAANSSAPGYLAAYPSGHSLPDTSTLNYAPGAIVANMAIVPLGYCGCTFNGVGMRIYSNADTDVIVDLMGVIVDPLLEHGLRLTPQTPVRIADTRLDQGAHGPLGQGATAAITAPPAVAPAGTFALALNVTAVFPTLWTYLSVWPAGIAGLGQPLVSTLNAAPGTIVPNAAYTSVGPTKAFNIYNNAGSVNVVVDVVGTFWDPDGGAASSSGMTAATSGPPLRPLSVSAGQGPVRLE